MGFRRVKLRLPPGMGKELEKCVEVSFYIHGKRDTKSGEEFRYTGAELQDKTLEFLRELAVIIDKVDRPLFIHPVDGRRRGVYERHLLSRRTNPHPVYILDEGSRKLDCIQHVEGHGNVMSSFSLRRDNFSHPDGLDEL